jgi:hypothetical protein
MVRNYIRKTRRAASYSHARLKTAIDEVNRGVKTLVAAANEYNIPKATLCNHVKGRRGKKSTGQGRATAIPIQMEQTLASGEKFTKYKYSLYIVY